MQDPKNCTKALKPEIKANPTPIPTPRPIELPEHTFFGLKTYFYTNKVETNNKFGTVKSNINKKLELDVSQRLEDWFKIHLILGGHELDYTLPFGRYTQNAFDAGLDMEFNVSQILSFNLGMIAGDDLVFREIQNTGIGFLAYEMKTHLTTNVAIYRNRIFNMVVSGSGIAIPAMDFYHFSSAYGLRYQAAVNVLLRKNELPSGRD